MIHISGDIVLYAGKEWVVTDIDPFESDATLDRVVLRPKDDPDGAFEAAHPDQAKIIGHLQKLEGWTEERPGVWKQA